MSSIWPINASPWAGGASTPGTAGLNGWTPVFSVVSDGVRRVYQVSDWTGGSGTKPAIGQYVGATGLVTDIAQAVDIRGPIGLTGSSAVYAGVVTRPLYASSVGMSTEGSLCGIDLPGEELVDSIMFIVPGTGNWEMFDAHSADASKQLLRRVASAGDAGLVVAVGESGKPVVFNNDIHMKLPAAGSPAAWVNVIDRERPKVLVDDIATTTITASGEAFLGLVYVISIKVLNPGSGNLTIYESVDVDSSIPDSIRFPTSALTAGQKIIFAGTQEKPLPSRFMNMAMSIPAGASLLVSYLPRL